MNKAVCVAIASRNLIHFEYDGFERVVEPHSHGFNVNRKEVLRGFQVRGTSRSGEPIGWKFFMVSRMINVAVLPERTLENRDGQAEAARELIIIHCATH